jgi:sulfur dioxygenase
MREAFSKDRNYVLLVFMQLRTFYDSISSTLTYLLFHNNEAILIDPVFENIDRDLSQIKQLGVNLKYVLETHLHADHITAAREIQNKTKAQIGLSKKYKLECANRGLVHGDLVYFGGLELTVLETPGHTLGCLSYYIRGHVFTGDSLLVGKVGRTDFQGGDNKAMYNSILGQLYQLPEETLVHPAHSYNGVFVTSIGIEKRSNERLNQQQSFEAFDQLMKNLNLSPPQKMDIALPANRNCGS